ncbi:protein NRT1/ PTR FAMILY 5.4-like [Castanea sativa]|uniref:protein NRT1/ PTR FAMILY 5.4-like n=1 Tax=Castanea sativa TaxID=21020 RepID=UPI003F650847
MIQNSHKDTKKQVDSAQQKPPIGGWNAAIFIFFVEVAERFAFFGLAANLITYLTNELHQPISTAAKNVNTWAGVSYIVPLFAAFVADSLFGRFNTILLASVIYVMGMILLTLSVSVVPLDYRKAIFFVALYIIAVGEGGHKPCVQTFAADQFEEDSLEDKKVKSSFFNWWFWGIVAGQCSAILVAIYVEDNVGWTAGIGMLAIAMAVALITFLLGIKRYRKQGPLGSPLTTVAQVLVAAVRKWRMKQKFDNCSVYHGDGLLAPGQPKTQTLAHTNQLRCLDKAMIIDNLDAMRTIRDPWRLCSLHQVEEVKLVLRLFPIWLSCLMFAIVISQMNTFFVKQGSTLQRSITPHFIIPPASLQALVGLTIILNMPIYDRVFVPIARKFTGHPSGITVLQRIGIGLFLSIFIMIVSALVEAKRINVVKEYNLLDQPKSIVPMKVWWLLPQYIITGLVEIFTYVGLQELFYAQMPEAMRSLGAAVYLSVTGIGNFISSAIISMVQAISSRYGEEWLGENINRAHLDYFYWVLAGLSALNLCIYVWIATRFVYKKVEDDDVPGEKESSAINGYVDGEII